MKLLLSGFTALVLMEAAPAAAASFCLSVHGIQPQCHYVDAALCDRDARRQQGQCVLNPAVPSPVIVGAAAFCAAESGALVCLYADRASCAARAGGTGVCIPALPRMYPPPDPFEATRPYY